MAGQGLLYVRIKRGYEFLYEGSRSDHGLEAFYLEKAGENNNHTVSIRPAIPPTMLFSLKVERIKSPTKKD